MAFIETNNIKFHYQLIGKGDRLVVFNHGLVMDNLSSWYFTLGNKIVSFARVLLYDMRGHGKTSRPKNGYHVEDFSADLDALLCALKIDEPVFLVGNSFGGLLNLAFAVEYPDRIRGMVLVDAHLSDEAFGADMKATLELQGIERDLTIAKYFKDWAGRHSERKRNRLAETASDLVYNTDMVKELENSRIIGDHELKKINAPVLAIYGENSNILDKGRSLARLLPNCELRIFPGCTHSVIWEATEELCRQAGEWIKEH